MNRGPTAHPTRAAVAGLLVALTLTGCGPAPDRLDPGSSTPASSASAGVSGASATATSPAATSPREDGPTPAATAPAGAVVELQQALDAANGLADEVDRDIAADGS